MLRSWYTSRLSRSPVTELQHGSCPGGCSGYPRHSQTDVDDKQPVQPGDGGYTQRGEEGTTQQGMQLVAQYALTKMQPPATCEATQECKTGTKGRPSLAWYLTWGPLPPSCDHANRNATSPASIRRVICAKRPLRPQVSIVHFRAKPERALITVSS